jgi:hypothetical protein
VKRRLLIEIASGEQLAFPIYSALPTAKRLCSIHGVIIFLTGIPIPNQRRKTSMIPSAVTNSTLSSNSKILLSLSQSFSPSSVIKSKRLLLTFAY